MMAQAEILYTELASIFRLFIWGWFFLIRKLIYDEYRSYLKLLLLQQFLVYRGKKAKQHLEKWREPSSIMLVGPEEFSAPKSEP